MALAPGTFINNRYRILSVLGQGGMGYVYQAEDTILKVPVAVKENLFLSDEYSRQFEREARILAGLRHGSLPQVSDFFLIPGQGQYLIMNYIEGEDLRERIERLGTVPVKDVIRIGVAICDALNYLHTRRETILHRDIKPGNIKITPEGSLVLVDFGLAKIMRGNQATTDGARAMTPGYSPPEQYGTARTDPRSDVYSLGATLYAALTGIIPEDGLDRATGNAKLTPIRQLQPGIDRKIVNVIEKSLEVDPENRYQTALEFQMALASAGEISKLLLEELRVSLPPVDPAVSQKPQKRNDSNDLADPLEIPQKTPAFRFRKKTTKKNIGLLPFGILLALTSMLALAVIIRPSIPMELLAAAFSPTVEGLPLSTDNLISNTGIDATATVTATRTRPSIIPSATSKAAVVQPNLTASSDPTTSPTITVTPIGGGRGQFAFVSNRSGIFQIWMMNIDGSQQQQLTNMEAGACQPSWSPDGMKVAFISPCMDKYDELYPGASIYIIDLADPELSPAALPVSSESGDFDPAWSPDGNRIAFSSMRIGITHVFIYDFIDGTLQEISDTRYADMHPAWSPDGTQLAVSRKIIFSHIFIVSDKGFTQYQLSGNGNVEDYWPAWSPDGKSLIYSRSTQLPSFPFLVMMNEADHGTGIEFRIQTVNGQNTHPVSGAVFSKDGKWILFESWPDGRNHDIFMVSPEGDNLTRVTTDPGFDFDPAWRPELSSQ